MSNLLSSNININSSSNTLPRLISWNPEEPEVEQKEVANQEATLVVATEVKEATVETEEVKEVKEGDTEEVTGVKEVGTEAVTEVQEVVLGTEAATEGETEGQSLSKCDRVLTFK
jgi:hypothetical protein